MRVLEGSGPKIVRCLAQNRRPAPSPRLVAPPALITPLALWRFRPMSSYKIDLPFRTFARSLSDASREMRVSFLEFWDVSRFRRFFCSTLVTPLALLSQNCVLVCVLALSLASRSEHSIKMKVDIFAFSLSRLKIVGCLRPFASFLWGCCS